MKTRTTGWQWVAIALALATLGLQITIGLEHLESASTATKASIVLVMISLAFLPKMVEIAAGARMFGLSAALLCAFVAWLAYSLPATVGRTGEVKEAKVMQAKATGEAHKLLLSELESAQQRLSDAATDAKAKCKNPASDNCAAARKTETERQSRVDVLLAEVIGAPAPASGDVASDLLAWLGSLLGFAGLSADAIRKGSVLAFAFGLDMVIWSLMWFGTTERLRNPPAAGAMPETSIDAAMVSPGLPPPGTRKPLPRSLSDEESLADIRREVSAGRHHGVVEYGVRWGVGKAEASKRITSFERDGEITCQHVGRHKLVTGIKRRLTTAA